MDRSLCLLPTLVTVNRDQRCMMVLYQSMQHLVRQQTQIAFAERWEASGGTHNPCLIWLCFLAPTINRAPVFSTDCGRVDSMELQPAYCYSSQLWKWRTCWLLFSWHQLTGLEVEHSWANEIALKPFFMYIFYKYVLVSVWHQQIMSVHQDGAAGSKSVATTATDMIRFMQLDSETVVSHTVSCWVWAWLSQFADDIK